MTTELKIFLSLFPTHLLRQILTDEFKIDCGSNFNPNDKSDDEILGEEVKEKTKLIISFWLEYLTLLSRINQNFELSKYALPLDESDIELAETWQEATSQLFHKPESLNTLLKRFAQNITMRLTESRKPIFPLNEIQLALVNSKLMIQNTGDPKK